MVSHDNDLARATGVEGLISETLYEVIYVLYDLIALLNFRLAISSEITSQRVE